MIHTVWVVQARSDGLIIGIWAHMEDIPDHLFDDDARYSVIRLEVQLSTL